MGKLSGKIDNVLSTLGTNNSSQIATAVLAGFKMFFIPAATARDKNATPEQKKYTMTRDVITEALALSTYIGITGQVQKHATAPICKSYYKNKAKMIEAGKIKPAIELTKDEVSFLKNVDAKKIQEAGMDFLTQKAQKPMVASIETKNYIQRLNGIIGKINGASEEVSAISLKEFLGNLDKNRIQKSKKGLSVLINDFKNATKPGKDVVEVTKLFQNTRIALSQVSVWVLALAVIPPLCNAIIKPVMNKLNAKKDNKENAVATVQTPNPTAGGVKKPQKNTMTRQYANMTNITNVGNMRV